MVADSAHLFDELESVEGCACGGLDDGTVSLDELLVVFAAVLDKLTKELEHTQLDGGVFFDVARSVEADRSVVAPAIVFVLRGFRVSSGPSAQDEASRTRAKAT